jgi:hypothetical protein
MITFVSSRYVLLNCATCSSQTCAKVHLELKFIEHHVPFLKRYVYQKIHLPLFLFAITVEGGPRK